MDFSFKKMTCLQIFLLISLTVAIQGYCFRSFYIRGDVSKSFSRGISLQSSKNEDTGSPMGVSKITATLKAKAAKLRAEALELEAVEKKYMLEKLSEIFDSFDTNKDGKISLEELKTGLSKMLSSSINEEQAKKIMDQFDTSGDGALQLEEFQSIDVFSSKFESILREERRAVEFAEQQAALAKEEAEKAEAIAQLINNRPPSSIDRISSLLPLLLPLLDALPFGKNFIFNLNLESNPLIELTGYLYVLYQNIPFAGLIAFILFNLLSNNLQLNRLVRYNIQLAIYLDIVLIFPGIIGAVIDGLSKVAGVTIPQSIQDGSSTVTFVAFGIALLYATVSSLLGQEADKLPFITDRIRERVPSTEEFQRMYKNYEELMAKREKERRKDDETKKR